MKVVTAEEMQNIDRITIDEMGIPGEVLMGYAGKSIADYILSNFTELKKTAVFCGTGNNGGDGFVIGYFLANNNIKVDIYLTGTTDRVSDTSRIYLNFCANNDINVIEVNNNNLFNIDVSEYDLIIDAMLGTGFKDEPRGIIKDAIDLLNNNSDTILSVDMPSGLASDGEAPRGAVIKADCTITVGLPKISCVTYPGLNYCGKLLLTDIGFPRSLTQSDDLKVDLINGDYVNETIDLKKEPDTHKGNEGHLLLIGGFDHMEGAIIMAAKAAFETGVGLCTLLTTGKARQVIAGNIPELITRSINTPDISGTTSSGHGGKNDLSEYKKKIKNELKNFFNEGRRYDALVIGPGIGRSEAASIIFETVINGLVDFGIGYVLIDGDGLFHLSRYLKKKKLPNEIAFIITPHFYEASRFIDKSIDEMESNRLNSAIDLAKETKTIALLKGPGSIVSDGTSSLINTTGNPALATAGSGDVLSGIIGALLLRDIKSLDAAGIGAYIHGLAADICVEENKFHAIKATDIIPYIRKVFLA